MPFHNAGHGECVDLGHVNSCKQVIAPDDPDMSAYAEMSACVKNTCAITSFWPKDIPKNDVSLETYLEREALVDYPG
jgi:hypothetical protein